MKRKELDNILTLHQQWWRGEEGGRCANLRSADLRRANLRHADLRSADLRHADLCYADLRFANLESADLRSADLRNTILDQINWLSYIGIASDPRGCALGYKLINNRGEGIFKGGIDYLAKNKFSVSKVDPDSHLQCSYGINLATFKWCLEQGTPQKHRILVMKFNIKDAVCPVASDGKFRVKKCTKVGEINFKGDYING